MPRILLNMPSQFAGKPSGVARVAFSLIRCLTASDRFTYILRSPWSRDDLPPDLARSRLDVLTVPRPRVMVANTFVEMLTLPRLCRRLGVDLLVNLDPYGSPAGAKARITLVHDLYFRAIPEAIGWRAVKTNDLVFRAVVRGSDHLVTVSDATRSDLERYYPAARGRTTTIYSDSTLDAPRLLAECRRLDATPPVSGRYIVIVGNATPNKNFAIVADAMAMLPDALRSVQVVHVGEDPGETIERRLAALGADIPLRRLTGVDETTLAWLYAHAEALVVPSTYEGFCLPVVEAQRFGCPVVCSNRSATPEIAGRGAATFDPDRPSELAEALVGVLTAPETRAALVRAGHANAERFSWEASARRYEDLFDAVLARR